MPSKLCNYFKHGVCVRKGDCPFKHDEAAIPADTRVAIKLRKFVAGNGGVVPAGMMSEFHKKAPEAKAVIGGQGLREFCKRHPQLLVFRLDTSEGTFRSVPIQEGAEVIKASGKASAQAIQPVAPPAAAAREAGARKLATEADVAKELSRFVIAEGGRREAGECLNMFYQRHPEAKRLIGSLQSFCQRHADRVSFEWDGRSGQLVSTYRAAASPRQGGRPAASSSARAKQPAPTAVSRSGSSVAVPRVGAPPALTTEAEVARALSGFVAARGGREHAGTCLGHFYEKHPEARQIIGSLQSFCRKHEDVISFQADGGSGKLVSRCSASGRGRSRSSSSLKSSSSPSKTVVAARWLARGCGQSRNSSCSASHRARDVEMEPRAVAKQLWGFLQTKGGSMHAGCMSIFFTEHPEAKQVIGAGKLARFCSEHPDLLSFDGDRHQLLAVAPGAKGARQEKSGDARAACNTAGQACPAQTPPAEEHSRVALLWKDYLDAGRQHLIGEERDVMKAAFDEFRSSRGIGKVGFGLVMSTLQKMGFKEHGTWRQASATASSSTAQPAATAKSSAVEATPARGAAAQDFEDEEEAEPAASAARIESEETVVSTPTWQGAEEASDPWTDGQDPWSKMTFLEREAPPPPPPPTPPPPTSSPPMRWSTPSAMWPSSPGSPLPSTTAAGSEELPSRDESMDELRASMRSLEESFVRLEMWEQEMDGQEKAAKEQVRAREDEVNELREKLRAAEESLAAEQQALQRVSQERQRRSRDAADALQRITEAAAAVKKSLAAPEKRFDDV